MPYIIYVPEMPRPYVTNDSRIYIDCVKAFGWTCESRPFSDSYCRDVRAGEERRCESERRCEQLEWYWRAELEKRKTLMAVTAAVDTLATVQEPIPAGDYTDSDEDNSSTTTEVFGKHEKRDSVHSVVVEVQELSMDKTELHTHHVHTPMPPESTCRPM